MGALAPGPGQGGRGTNAGDDGSAGLARHKLPARLLIVGALPRTAAGKVRKADLRHLLAGAADGG